MEAEDGAGRVGIEGDERLISGEGLSPVDRLRGIMHRLRAPGGCPWDAEQTHESLIPNLIEEAYEVAEAIRSGEEGMMVEELGDLLLQPIFHAELGAERGDFDLDDVATAICEKLVRRHPHVFGERGVEGTEGVLKQWEQIKDAEKEGKGSGKAHYLDGMPVALPALMRAQKIQKKVAKVGFDWAEAGEVLAKVKEEVGEVEAEVSGQKSEGGEALGEEIGDLLFAVVNLARKSGLDAEELLARANDKFVERFVRVEAGLAAKGRSLEEASLEEMEAEWGEAKAG
ncbi:MAG: nucleoside triphosphate pyrophosphohydrolase [Verrucomicrobiota bacterium]